MRDVAAMFVLGESGNGWSGVEVNARFPEIVDTDQSGMQTIIYPERRMHAAWFGHVRSGKQVAGEFRFV